MDTKIKARNSKYRTVRRYAKELINAIDSKLTVCDIEHSIDKLILSFEELGKIQDGILDDTDEEEHDDLISWYDAKNLEVNTTISQARNYIEDSKQTLSVDSKLSVSSYNDPYKLEKLRIPKFKSDPKEYLKWKSIFERFTAKCDESVKYDYLFAHTEGDAHDYVNNRKTYSEAIQKLDKSLEIFTL